MLFRTQLPRQSRNISVEECCWYWSVTQTVWLTGFTSLPRPQASLSLPLLKTQTTAAATIWSNVDKLQENKVLMHQELRGLMLVFDAITCQSFCSSLKSSRKSSGNIIFKKGNRTEYKNWPHTFLQYEAEIMHKFNHFTIRHLVPHIQYVYWWNSVLTVSFSGNQWVTVWPKWEFHTL